MTGPWFHVFRLIAITCVSISFVHRCRSAETPVSQAQTGRGKLIYLQNCVLCHQSSGQGSPGVFPPLARSDFLMSDKKRSILALVQGLSGKIEVNGTTFNGAMPPALLDDQKVAEVLTFVRNSFGNSGDPVTADEVKTIRSNSRYPTYAALVEANKYPQLPAAPAGFTLREVVRLPDHGTRLASDCLGKALYVLSNGGDVWRVETANGQLKQILRGRDYLNPKDGEASTVGLYLDSGKRFYIVADQRDESGQIVTNNVTIFRTTGTENGEPAQPKPWFRTSYPWGIGPFNHGVGNVAVGPDGWLYVSSGSRTDGNEAGKDSRYFQGGEVPLTACIWRLDAKAEKPEIEVFARGLRNPYGFCWDAQGRMFASDNGPDADAPEELNLIEKGRHYGFPYQFSDWTNKPYAYTPDPPSGVQFTRPIANLGPAGGFNGHPIYSFDPHSSPAGIAWLGPDFPLEYRGTLFVARFGNLIKTPRDVGFDLLQVRLDQKMETAKVTTVLAPLGRPLDVHLAGKGKIYVLEYTRQTDNKPDLPMLPGRILELAVKR